MVLVAFVGDLGAGKTLGMTYILYKKYLEGRKIFSNYHLNDKYMEYTIIHSADEINDMKNGIFGGDELWLWLDSRETARNRNKFISSILIKSRKREIEILYTTQSFMQIDVRIRRITDFVVEPQLNDKTKICRLNYYRTPSWIAGSVKPDKIIKFYAPLIWNTYDTREEIESLEDND